MAVKDLARQADERVASDDDGGRAVSDGREHLEAERGHISPKWHVGVGCLVAVLTYGVMLGDGHTIFAFAGKEQFFEHMSAWLFLLSSLLALACWRRSRGQETAVPPLRRASYVLLAIFFFVAFGEELSWGQHYFGFATPEAIEHLNQQEELNLHNLAFVDSNDDSGKKRGLMGKLLNSNRLFDYFMLGLFMVVPLGGRLWPAFGAFYKGLGPPLMALTLALPLGLNAILSVISEVYLVDNTFRHMATSEIRELNYALLCFLGMLWLWAVERQRQLRRSVVLS